MIIDIGLILSSSNTRLYCPLDSFEISTVSSVDSILPDRTTLPWISINLNDELIEFLEVIVNDVDVGLGWTNICDTNSVILDVSDVLAMFDFDEE